MATYDARPSAFTQMTTMAEWEAFLSGCGVSDGVDGVNSFVPSLDTGGRNAVISAGSSLIKGQLWRADAPVSTPIPAASAQNRIDRLVLQLNRTASTSPTIVQPVVVTGVPAASPVIPPLVQNASGIYQIPISNWTSTSAGALSGLSDQRQYCGRNVVSMTSVYRTAPANPCVGLETDTGYIYTWNGSTWATVSTDTAVLQSGNTNATGSLNAMFAPFPIPANDAANTVSVYRVRCGGHGSQASGNPVNLNFQIFGFGTAMGNKSDNGNMGAGVAFTWYFDCTVIVNPNGAYSMFGNMTLGNKAVSFDQQGNAGSLNTAAATNIVLQAGWASITGGPTIVCTGATFERLAN